MLVLLAAPSLRWSRKEQTREGNVLGGGGEMHFTKRCKPGKNSYTCMPYPFKVASTPTVHDKASVLAGTPFPPPLSNFGCQFGAALYLRW